MSQRILTEEQLLARREYNKRYRETHREIERERQKRFRENNPERSRELKRESRRRSYIPKTREVLSEEEIKIKHFKQKEQMRKRYENNFVSVEKICKYCGRPFMTQYKKSKVYCSEECKNKQEHYYNKMVEKRRKGKITALDRLDNDITLPLLFKRDKGICKLCGGLCNYEDWENKNGVIVVGNTYPSVDHIKPISKGGSHTWDNVQLAHKYCNSIKSNKET